LSDDDKAKSRHFEIIKELHTAQTTGKRYLNYEDLEANLHLDRGSVVNSLNVLQSFGFVRTYALAVILETKALNTMESYHPKTFQEFVSKYNNPPKEYGEAVRIEGPRGSFWEDHPFIKKITPLGSIITIIAFASWIIYTIFVGK